MYKKFLEFGVTCHTKLNSENEKKYNCFKGLLFVREGGYFL